MERYIENLDYQKSNMDKFLEEIKRKEEQEANKIDLSKDPQVQAKHIAKACDQCKIVSLDKMLGKIYKDAIPIEGPMVDVDKDISDYIKTKTNKGTEFYIHEGLKKTKSPFLSKMLEAADKMSKAHRERKEKMLLDGCTELSQLSMYNYDNQEDENLRRITSDMGLDEISDIIRGNVKNTILDEIKKNETEQNEIKNIEDELSQNDNITDQETMESTANKMVRKRQLMTEFYQPSLFEGILKYYTENYSDKNNSSLFYKTVCDYTLLSTMKALQLEKFDNRLKLTSMARNYKK